MDNVSPQIVYDAHAFADKAGVKRPNHTLFPRVKGFSVLRNAGQSLVCAYHHACTQSSEHARIYLLSFVCFRS